MEYDEFAAAVIEALNTKAEYKTDTDYVSRFVPEKGSHFEYKLWEFKRSEQYKDALKKNKEFMPSEETLRDMYRLYETLQRKHTEKKPKKAAVITMQGSSWKTMTGHGTGRKHVLRCDRLLQKNISATYSTGMTLRIKQSAP